jgi:hypothetical protein
MYHKGLEDFLPFISISDIQTNISTILSTSSDEIGKLVVIQYPGNVLRLLTDLMIIPVQVQ